MNLLEVRPTARQGLAMKARVGSDSWWAVVYDNSVSLLRRMYWSGAFVALLMSALTACGDGVTQTGNDTVGAFDLPAIPPVCEPGLRFCQGSDLWVCNEAGTDLDMTTCPGQCDEGQCIESCTPNTSRCITVDTLEVCTGQGLAVTQQCENGCADGACQEQSSCTPGEILCDKVDNKLIKCNSFGSDFFTVEVCKNTCSEDTNECIDIICVPGESRCSPDQPKVLEVCEPGGTLWKPSKFCPGKCENGACAEVNCEAGELICGPEGIEECAADESAYVLKEACDVTCVTGNDGQPSCALCQEGYAKCKNQKILQKCSSGQKGWEDYLLCGTLQTCQDGQCKNMITLSPDVPIKTNYMALTKAFIHCWQGGSFGFCRAINTTDLTYPIAAEDISSWFCNEAKKADFIDESAYEAGKDMMGCGIVNLEDLTFQTGVINPNLNGVECIGLADTEIIVDYCVNF